MKLAMHWTHGSYAKMRCCTIPNHRLKQCYGNADYKGKRIMEMFERHVKLIMTQDSASKNDAKFIAWCEGSKGYWSRLESDEAKK